MVYTASDLAQADTGFGPVTQLADVTVQAYNYGYGYDANWSRLAVGGGSCGDLTALFEPPTPTAAPTETPTPTPSDPAADRDGDRQPHAAGDALIATAALPAGSPWSAVTGKGYRYRDGAAPGGLQKGLLRTGADGKSKGFAKGKSSTLQLPALGNLPLPLTAQLLSPQGGACLGSVFDTGAVVSNDARKFKAKAQP